MTKQGGRNLEFGNQRGLVAMAIKWAKGDKGFFWKDHIHPDEQENMIEFKSNLYGGKNETNQNQLKHHCLWVV